MEEFSVSACGWEFEINDKIIYYAASVSVFTPPHHTHPSPIALENFNPLMSMPRSTVAIYKIYIYSEKAPTQPKYSDGVLSENHPRTAILELCL